MKIGKRSAEERAEGRLLDYWQHKVEYGMPVGCVATTFTFDAAFFEEHCLGRFIGIESDATEDARTYLVEREEKLASTFAAVLVDQSNVPRERSLRWQLLPVRVGNGIQHAKVSLLVWQHRIRVVVASANITEPGYRKNFEVAAALDFTAAGDVPLALLFSTLDFLEDVRLRAPDPTADKGPQPALRGFLAGVRNQVATWNDVSWKRGEPSASLVFTGPGRESLFDQIRELWPFPPPDHAVVTSPFFDDGDAATITAQNLESIMNQRGDRRICFVVQATTLPNLAIQLELPRCLKASQRARTEYVHYRVLQGRDEQRALHAKILHLERDNQGIHCIGSSNFTRAGTGARTDGGPINVEANLVYILPDVKSDFGRVCDLARPNDEEVDSDNATFITPNDSSADASGYVALPKCFVSAVLRNDDGLLSLELQITGATPDEFQVLLPDNGVLLSAEDFVGIDRPALVQCRLAKNQAISYLLVTWRTNEQWVTGVWPVNVANNFVLPPAEELRDLNLEELLEILSAGGPAYLLLGRMLKRREARRNDPLAFETDPHKRIDTRHHLLKRMRRTAIALEELRSRIERATYSREALHWRLHGPLGPLALAGKLVAEESAHAAFFLAEVALTLASATLDPQGDLTRAEATTMIADVIQTLKLQANSHAAPANLSEYVKNTFLEVRS